MHWYFGPFKKYAVFNGRASLKEFWMFFILNLAISWIIALTIWATHAPSNLNIIYRAIVFLPSISIAVRRMHDSNNSGWWVLLPIVNLIFLAEKGQETENNYGPPSVSA